MPANAPREYILEKWVGERTVDAYVLPNVNFYERRPIPALSREWTAGQRPVKQSAGIREEEIRLQGVSGRSPSGVFTVQSGARPTLLNSGEIDGVLYFETLLAWLADYEAEAAKYRSVWVQSPAQAPTMVFRDLGSGLAWYVDDIQIVPLSKTGSSSNSYEYSLSCKTEGVAQATPYRTLTNTPTLAIPRAETGVQATLLATTKPPVAGTDAAGNALQTQADALPAQSLVQTLEDLPGDLAFYAPPVRAFLAQVEGFAAITATALRAGLGIPRDAARNFRTYAETCARIVYRLWDALQEPSRSSAMAARDDILSGVNALRGAVTTLLGGAGSKLGPAGQPVTLGSGAAGSGAQVCQVERVRQGEDLQAFALRVLGLSGRWMEIADLNQMSSPWSLQDGSPLIPGTPLLVPLVLPLDFERTPDGDAGNIFGTDLLWDFEAFDFVVEGTEPTDFLAVTGPSNLRQGLFTRFTTAQGGVLVRPNMGLPDTIGQVATPARAALKASQVVTQAGADPRIRAVRRVAFTETANVQRAEIDVEPITDQAFSVSLPV